MNRKRSFWVVAGEYTSLAFLLPASTVAGYAVGYYLDRAMGTSFLKIVFLTLGVAGGFVQLIRQVQKDAKNRDD